MMQRLRSYLFRQQATPPLPPEIKRGDFGWAQSQLYSAQIPKYNPDQLIGRKGHGIYRQMLLDEQVKAVVKFKRDAITSRDYEFIYDGEDEKRIEIYKNMVEQSEGSFIDGINYVMKAQYQGFSLTEKIYDSFLYENTPYIGLKRLMPKPYETFEFFTDEYGNVTQTVQKMSGAEQNIDLKKFIYFVCNPEYDQHYGQSELREAYRSWYSKDAIIRFYNLYLERFAGGFLIAKPTEGATLSTGTPEYQAMVAILNSIQSTSSVLLPNNVDMDVKAGSSTDQFEKAIMMHDMAISKALLVPNLLGITPQGGSGSFSQANTQLEAFLWTLDADTLRLEEVLNEQLFNPLSMLNFMDGKGPKIRFKPVSQQKKFEIIKVWKELVTAHAVEATDSDEEYLRSMLDFPDKGEPLELGGPDTERQTSPVEGKPVKQQPDGVERVDESVLGEKVISIDVGAFNRASKRVAFNVIDRQTSNIERTASEAIADRLANMVAEVAIRVLDENLGTPAAIAEPHTVDFSSRERAKVKRAIDSFLKEAWNLGLKHANDEIMKAKREPFSINMGRITGNVDEFLKSNGFRMLASISDEMKATIQGILANALKYSWTPKETVIKIYDRLTESGYVFAATNAEQTGRTVVEVLESIGEGTDIYRVKTAVRTNTFEALNEARYSTFTDPDLDDFIEGLEYSAILDGRTTEICRHLNDRVYPAYSSVWNSYRPPNHFNCRSILVPVTIVDTDVVGKDNEKGSRYSKDPTKDPQKGFG